MKKAIIILLVITTISACDIFQQVAKTATDSMNEPSLSTSEMAEGLKSALAVGTDNSVKLLNAENGFLNDNTVKIPFPQEIIKVKEKLEAAGLSDLTNKFVSELNKGASVAVKEALPIFKQAITDMTIDDAKNILLGEKNAATTYFKSKTKSKLYTSFKPKVTTVLENYGINTAYTKMMEAYNKIPLVTPQNTDLPDYVTNKAMDGLFLKITLEEAKIRENINSRVNDILKKVFAWADSQKK
ncbi:MAG: hypothetical protein A2W91_11015 [Bacteroidetes bacterium GWF2_38_335]|nr:MAG: hypothetical protein A2W91_11015 [Bacteroidetes bacterium GWF2_38_335]OFY81768.1 MAG: hypothetical protein A2281_06025 [Bacteroidetes bacterium RIFOXYA12_FULL_38_20]HBS87838.1 DUF4197 domain-containing protein [Bacteroidales bacterium]